MTVSSGKVVIKNFADYFNQFINESISKDPETCWETWLSLIDTKVPDFYRDLVIRAPAGVDFQSKYKEAFFNALPVMRDHASLIEKEFRDCEKQVLAGVSTLSKIFPDFGDIVSVNVYAMPSLMRFNGFCSKYKESSVLAFGIDMIAVTKVNPAIVPKMKYRSHSSVLYTHEIFHIYHNYKSDGAERNLFLWQMWSEGLATYVSGIATDGASLSDLFMDERLGQLSADEKFRLLKTASKEFLKPLDTNEGKAVFRDWFLLSSQRNDIPLRAGYAAGYALVTLLFQTSSINEMVSWNTAILRRKIEEFIPGLTV